MLANRACYLKNFNKTWKDGADNTRKISCNQIGKENKDENM